MAVAPPDHQVAWAPQEGPQTLFVQCPAYEVGYGGALGGGKTDALLGKFASGIDQGSGYKGIFFRKHFPDMDDVIQRSVEIFEPVYGMKCYNASKYQWKFPNGALLQFRALERDVDVNKYVGQQYCVAAQQLTRMGDGSLKEIQDVRVGDMVETLEGPRAVLATHGPYTKECVESVTVDASGSIDVQVHPLDHEVLMASGEWGSYASSASGQIFDKESFSRYQDAELPPLWFCRVALCEPDRLSVAGNLPFSTRYFVRSRSLGSLYERLEDPKRALRYLRLLHELAGSPLGPDILPTDARDGAYGPLGLETAKDSLDRCSVGSRPHGGLPRFQSDSGLGSSPSPACVASHSRSDCTTDALDSALEHIPSCGFVYEHPYTGDIRISDRPISLGSCVMAPCGQREVYDLTVDSVSHYITPHGVVNRNSTIMWDQLEQWESPWAYTFLMTRNRSAKGIACQILSAFNPGGIGHGWVKARFIDPMPSGVPLKVETKTDGNYYYRVFIPAKLEDNQILMRNDPNYADRIYEMSDPLLAEALREGVWDKVSGAAFPEFDKRIHVIDPQPMPYDKPIIRCMDWGYDKPYCNLWGFPDNDGNVIIGAELYGWSGQPNVGTREAPETVRSKIENYERAHELFVPKGLLDNQCWEADGRTSIIAEQLGGHRMGWKPWPKGPNSRINQKQNVHNFMRVINGSSRLKIMRNCHHLIRTLPILPRQEKNWEDVNTDSEDHAYDALRALLTEKLPTRDEIRKRAMRRRLEQLHNTRIDLPYGGW